MMTEKKLRREMQSVGMKCFVRFFESLACNVPTEKTVEKLLRIQSKEFAQGKPSHDPWTNKWDEIPCVTRVNASRRIFDARKEKRALEMVRDSIRLHTKDKMRAMELLKKME